MRQFFIVMVTVFIFALTWQTAFAREGVDIQYTPIKIFKGIGHSFPVELNISNFSGIPVTEVQVWYRWAGESRFKMSHMDNEGFSYYAALDIGEGEGELLEYYFTVAYLDNRRESLPADAPASRIFRTAVQTLRNYGDQIIVISPEEEEQLYSTDVVISASFSSLMSMIDPEKTKLYLNTWDVTPYLQKFGDFITFAPRSVPPGRHKIRLELYGTDGNLVASREWYFSGLAVRGQEALGEGWNISGRFFAESRNEDLSRNLDFGDAYDLKNSYNQSGLQLRAQYNDWTLGGRVYFSNQEKSDRQPVNRYSGFARFNFWDQRYAMVEIGDAYPKLNPMIMQNIFMRGVYARLYLKSFNIDFATGKTNRGVDGSLVQSPTDTFTVYGTYQRNITTIRPSFGSGEKFQLGFTYLKGKDDEGSIRYGINPQENAAFGADLFFGLDQRRIIFEGNISTSLYNRNIAGGDIPFDSLDAVFDGISDSDKSIYDWAGKFVTVNQYLILQPGMAYQGRLLLRYFRNNLSFIYESVDEDYFSLGQPYLLRDNRGFHIVDNISLIRNQVFLTLGYRQYHNNLADIKSNTTKIRNYYGNISYFPLQNLPEITIGYNNYSRNNNVTADSIDSILNRPEDNNTTAINLSAGYRFGIQGTRNRVGLDFMSYQRDDIFKYAESTTDNITANLRTQFAIPLETLLEVIVQQTETGKDVPDLRSNLEMTTFGVGGNYRFHNLFTEDHLLLQVNLRFGSVKSVYGLASTAPQASEQKFNRNYYSFRINYSLPRYGNFGFIADLLSYGGDRDYSDFIYTLRYDITF
ncbi:MAG: hypothetical protein JSW33_16410 [bacterium]|nr:MAG: hypothetical protein JSW33_16410 [bacterium]